MSVQDELSKDAADTWAEVRKITEHGYRDSMCACPLCVSIPFKGLHSAKEEQGRIYRATELEWLTWFAHHADFGPAHGDVMVAMRDAFELEVGRRVPDGWRGEE